MKKHSSIFGFFVRSSIFQILGIFLLMGAVEVFFFHRQLQDALEAFAVVGNGFVNLEQLFARSASNVYFAAAFLLTTVVLCLPGCSFRSNTGYTFQRLSISESAVFFHQAFYNFLIYIFLAAWQLAVAFGLCRYYTAAAPEGFVSAQTVFLAFYRSEFLHTLLPLGDIGLWIRNGFLAVSLGLSAAAFPFKQRRKAFSTPILALVIYTVVYFERGIGDIFHVVIVALITAAIIAEVIYSLRKSTDQEVSENA